MKSDGTWEYELDPCAGVIMAFNLSTLSECEIMFPLSIQIKGFGIRLVVLDGCMCLVCHNHDKVVV